MTNLFLSANTININICLFSLPTQIERLRREVSHANLMSKQNFFSSAKKHSKTSFFFFFLFRVGKFFSVVKYKLGGGDSSLKMFSFQSHSGTERRGIS